MYSTTSLGNSVSLPNLPGILPARDSWIFKQKEGFRRSSRPKSAVDYRLGSGSTLLSDTGLTLSEAQTSNQDAERKLLIRPYSARPAYRSEVSSHDVAPDNDKIVCRFYGHILEDRVWAGGSPLGVPNIEKKIQRKLTIFYYVKDNTISMTETVANNSGLTGGSFYKRAPLIKETGKAVTLRELAPGSSICALGRVFYIDNCDAFTRDYFVREFNVVLSAPYTEPEEFREDSGAVFATGFVSTLPSQKSFFGSQSAKYVAETEARTKTNRFFMYEGKVLRFLCVDVKDLGKSNIRDTKNLSVPDSAKKFALSYFLADRSIDIRVVKPSSGTVLSGKGNTEGMLLMKRSKITKNWKDLQRNNSVAEPEYYEPEELLCGNVVDVYGRGFLLLSCDNFTRSMYRDMGYTQIDIPIYSEREKSITHPIPKLGDGFMAIGSEEDTLATVYGMPKVTRDWKKAHKNQHRILRAKLKMVTSEIIDSTRNFMLTLYLEDDTLFIFEEAGRNSGIQSGTFLKRGKYKNTLPFDSEEPRYFQPTDIYLGNIIGFNGNVMKIVEMDNLSLKFCETYPDEFPFFDPLRISKNLANIIRLYGINLRQMFESTPKKFPFTVPKEEMLRVLDQKILSEINEQELLTLLRLVQVDEPSNQFYYYQELCDLFSHAYALVSNGLESGTDSKSPRSIKDINTLFKSARIQRTQWRRMFRKDKSSIGGLTSLDSVIYLLKKNGFSLSNQAVSDLINNYAATPLVANAYFQQLQATLPDESNKALRGTTNSVAAILPSPFKRLDDRTSPVAKESVFFSAKSTNSSSVKQLTIAEKREQLLKASKAMDSTKSESTTIEGKAIDYLKLCDDIYVCDWA